MGMPGRSRTETGIHGARPVEVLFLPCCSHRRAGVPVALSRPVAAIRVPLLRVSKFNEGMPELVKESFVILVLVLPINGDRVWTTDEVDVVEVVTDPVAVALSHAAIITEESLLMMRERLMVHNMALDRAHRKALLAKETRKSLQSVMTREIVGPIHLVAALLSALQLWIWVQTVRVVGLPSPSQAASCAAWAKAWVEPLLERGGRSKIGCPLPGAGGPIVFFKCEAWGCHAKFVTTTLAKQERCCVRAGRILRYYKNINQNKFGCR